MPGSPNEPSNLPESVASDAPLVLIVEDNPVNARLTADMLRVGGYRTQLATNGHEGLRLARELQPALILTDLQMPGLDGLGMTKLLKEDASTAPIPVIAVTAHAMSEHHEAALQAGCRSFISKPFRFRDFLAEINHAFQEIPG